MRIEKIKKRGTVFQVKISELSSEEIASIFQRFVQPAALEMAAEIAKNREIPSPFLITKEETTFGGTLIAVRSSRILFKPEFTVEEELNGQKITNKYGVCSLDNINEIEYESISGNSAVTAQRTTDSFWTINGVVTLTWLLNLPKTILGELLQQLVERQAE